MQFLNFFRRGVFGTAFPPVHFSKDATPVIISAGEEAALRPECPKASMIAEKLWTNPDPSSFTSPSSALTDYVYRFCCG
jgi:hypothetical protein